MGRLRPLDPLLEEAIEDRLYQDKKIIDNLAKLVAENVEAPYSIAVSGSWGAGKTTVLKALQGQLGDRGYPTIWFNPWEYDGSGDVVLALQKHIAMEFKDKFHLPLRELGIFGMTLIASTLNTLAKLATDGSIAYGDVKEIQQDVKDALESKKAYEAYKDPVAALRRDFVALTGEVSKRHEGRSLVILLDDLDRCLPENALRVIDAMRNLFVIKGARVVAISAIDTEVAKSFIQRKYEGVDHSFAVNYFRKIFNLTLELPSKPVRPLEAFLEDYTARLFTGEGGQPESGLAADLPQVGKIAREMVRLANTAGTTSVRALLNVINDYFVVRKTTVSPLDYECIAPILFLREVWNEFYTQLRMESLRLEGKVLSEALAAEATKRFYDRDERLKRIWGDFVKKDVSILELRKANLI
jgi:hypothetical protein